MRRIKQAAVSGANTPFGCLPWLLFDPNQLFSNTVIVKAATVELYAEMVQLSCIDNMEVVVDKSMHFFPNPPSSAGTHRGRIFPTAAGD